jgi:hypothetical protein
MVIKRWDKKLSEFLSMVESGAIRINKRYQRSGKVWPLNAKSYLVETTILGFALPRLMLHQVAGRRGASSYIDIVDGQQRTAALLAFRQDSFRLSAVVDRDGLRGKRYSTLEPADRAAFDSYVLRSELFEDATDEDIREVFRRINSYTVPLNPEEQRHAKYQGEFKWFLHRQCEQHSDKLRLSGLLTEKRIDRMADAKLLTEICHAMIQGVTTTDARVLKRLYKEYDPEFELDRDFSRRFSVALSRLASWGPLPKTLAKPHHGYSLILALLYALEPLPALNDLFSRHRDLQPDGTILRNLTTLAAALDLEEGDVPDAYLEFFRASDTGTNVRAARETRCRWFYRALTSSSI